MADNPVWAICERVAKVQALLHDHVECGKHSAADVVAKAQAVLSEPELLRRYSMSATSRRTRRRLTSVAFSTAARKTTLVGDSVVLTSPCQALSTVHAQVGE
jgi:hypothetical protein